MIVKDLKKVKLEQTYQIMNNEEIKDILDNAFTVMISTKEKGLLNEHGSIDKYKLEKAKEKALNFANKYLTNEFVKVEFDGEGLGLNIDMKVLSGEDYNKLIQLLDNE